MEMNFDFADTVSENLSETASDTVSETSSARMNKAALKSLVHQANEYHHCGYTPEEEKKQADRLWFNVTRYNAFAKANEKNRVPLSVDDDVQEMIVFAQRKMNRFCPEKGNYATFLIYAYDNHRKDEYEKNKRLFDIDSYEQTLSRKDEGDDYSYEDLIGTCDTDSEQAYNGTAMRACCRDLQQTLRCLLTPKEYEVYMLNVMRGMKTREIAPTLQLSSKEVDNALCRARTKVRRYVNDHLAEMEVKLQKEYGYDSFRELLNDRCSPRYDLLVANQSVVA